MAHYPPQRFSSACRWSNCMCTLRLEICLKHYPHSTKREGICIIFTLNMRMITGYQTHTTNLFPNLFNKYPSIYKHYRLYKLFICVMVTEFGNNGSYSSSSSSTPLFTTAPWWCNCMWTLRLRLCLKHSPQCAHG